MADPLRVLDVAEAMRSILASLDFQGIEKLLVVLQLDDSGRTVLQDDALWRELIDLHFGRHLPEELAFLALPKKKRVWQWTDSEIACAALQQFLRIGDERDHFLQTVSVVRGDIGKIKDIQGIPVDGLAFPTNAYLSNHFIGAAAAIFQRAGKGLSDLMNTPANRNRRAIGDAVPTPAFDAGVKRLIHCVGPRFSQENCLERLYATYENVMNAALAEDLHCVAIASISTGAMGIPVHFAAPCGLRAIQKFVRANHWDGKVVIVCLEENVLEAFEKEYSAIVAKFNDVPPMLDVREAWQH